MPSRFRRSLPVLAVVLAVLAVAYWWLVLEWSPPTGPEFRIDVAELRALAEALPGDKPTEVHFEHVATVHFPEHAVLAGSSWAKRDLPVYAWQLVYPDHTAMVDSGLDRPLAEGADADFEPAAYARIQRGLEAASLLVITHEHFDHIGGLASATKFDHAFSIAALTKEQLTHPDKMKPVVFAPGVLEGHPALSYERTKAIAPGLVLLKAPGHTPGSQMVYARLADGRELLFVGDVAWHRENVEQVRPRARLVTWFFIGEDRDAVQQELAALHALHEAEPKLALIPGHDGRVVQALAQDGIVSAGFKAQ